MTKPEWCHRSTMLCNPEKCVLYVQETDQCFDEIEKIYKMSQMRTGENVQAPLPQQSLQTPVLDAIKPDNPFPELKPKGFLPAIAGRITSAIEIREVETSRGPIDIANFMLTDGAKEVRIAVWEPGDKLNGFNVGSWITLTNMSVKDPYDNVAQISTTRKTQISR